MYQKSDLLSKVIGSNVELVEFVWDKESTAVKIFDNKVINSGRVQRYSNSKLKKSSILIYHSSSIDWLKPYILNSFSEVEFIWGHSVDFDYVEERMPDIVLTQTNERFLQKVPVDKK